MATGLSLPARRTALHSSLFWIGLAVTVAFSFLALRGVHFGDVWDALRTSDYWWLVPSLALVAVAIFIRILRWRYLFEPETRPSLGGCSVALLVCYLLNNVLPVRAGELGRIVVLKQREDVSRVEAAGTIVVERVFDVLALLLVLFVILPWLPHVSWLTAAAVLAIVLGVALAAVVIVLAVWGERPIRFLSRPLGWLPFVSAERAEWAARNLARGFAGLRRPRLAGAAFLLTVVSWLVIAFSWWLLMQGFGLDVSPLASLLVVVASNLALILPSSPAGLGVFEAAVVLALGAYGVSNSVALSYALVLHAVNFLPFVIVGGIVLHRHAAGVRRRGVAPTPVS
jgi:glycosyltransferase 2 family protein